MWQRAGRPWRKLVDMDLTWTRHTDTAELLDLLGEYAAGIPLAAPDAPSTLELREICCAIIAELGYRNICAALTV